MLNTPAQAIYQLPSVFVQDLKIQPQNGSLNVEFTALNKSKQLVNNLIYQVEILGPLPQALEDLAAGKSQLILDTAPRYDRRLYSNQVFSLPPGGTRRIAFSYQPPPLPRQQYRLRVRILFTNGRKLGWEDKALTLGAPENVWVALTPGPVARANGEQQPPRHGINVEPQEIITLHATGKAPGPLSYNLFPVLTIYPWDITNKPLQTKKFPPITFAPAKEVPLQWEVPAPSRPEAYHATIVLVDAQGNQRSNLLTYRWVVKGVSGKIITATFKKPALEKGDLLEIEVSAVGPADRETRTRGKLEIELKDRKGTVTKKQTDILLNANVQTITVLFKLPRAVQGLSFVAVLKDEKGNILDSYEAQSKLDMGKQKELAQAAPKAQRKSRWLLWAGIGVGIVVLLAAIIAYLQWRRGTYSSSSFLILLAALFLLPWLVPHLANANGINVLRKGYSDLGLPHIELFINKPIHDSTKNGKRVRVELDLKYSACDNEPTFADLTILHDTRGGKSSAVNLPHPSKPDIKESYSAFGCEVGKHCREEINGIVGAVNLGCVKYRSTTMQFRGEYWWKRKSGPPHGKDYWNIWLNFNQLPDLKVSSVEVAPASPTPGERLSFRAKIKNVGCQDTESTRVKLKLDVDQDGTIDQVFSQKLPKLHPGKIVTVQWEKVWKASPGDHRIIIRVDPGDKVKEANEKNNKEVFPFSVKAADLVARNLAILGKLEENAAVKLQGKVRNDGEVKASSSSGRFCLLRARVGGSRSKCLQNRTQYFVHSWDKVLPSLRSGAEVSRSTRSWTAVAGTFNVVWCADAYTNANPNPPGAVWESDERLSSNCEKKEILMSGRADLVPLAPDLSGKLAVEVDDENDTATLQARVFNQGGEASTSSRARFCVIPAAESQNPDSALETLCLNEAAGRLGGDINIPELAPESAYPSYPNEDPLTANTGVLNPGHYQAIFCVDSATDVEESDEDNNCFSTVFAITPPPSAREDQGVTTAPLQELSP
jgi:hypothetical protein